MHGSVVVFPDVTEQRKIAHEMSYQATHDALTGLYNRRAFEDRLGQFLANAVSDRMQHALLYIDLDQFKIVNDACGHPAGDQLLRQLAAVLRKETRQSDLLARLGGDELGVLLHSCPADEANQVAHNLPQTINDFRFVWKDRTSTIGASIGLVSFGGGPQAPPPSSAPPTPPVMPPRIWVETAYWSTRPTISNSASAATRCSGSGRG